jgi:hypothetical protein
MNGSDLGSNAQKACRFKSCSRHQRLNPFTISPVNNLETKQRLDLLARVRVCPESLEGMVWKDQKSSKSKGRRLRRD